jgi:hypothetical protein
MQTPMRMVANSQSGRASACGRVRHLGIKAAGLVTQQECRSTDRPDGQGIRRAPWTSMTVLPAALRARRSDRASRRQFTRAGLERRAQCGVSAGSGCSHNSPACRPALDRLRERLSSRARDLWCAGHKRRAAPLQICRPPLGDASHPFLSWLRRASMVCSSRLRGALCPWQSHRLHGCQSGHGHVVGSARQRKHSYRIYGPRRQLARRGGICRTALTANSNELLFDLVETSRWAHEAGDVRGPDPMAARE